MHRPHILWFSIEDTGPRLGCYGDPVARTPNLDRLAAEGCRYERAFAVAGVCAPSRSAIITGMYPTFIGAHHMRTTGRTHGIEGEPGDSIPPLMCYGAVPPPYVKCFPEYLRAAGYYCTNNSKTDYQFTPPCSAWDECHGEAHWRHRAPGQPFFAVFNPLVTHESGMWDERPGGPSARVPALTDPATVIIPPYLPDTPRMRTALARHYDNLAAADRQFGEIWAQLEADGELDNTIIFVWSDHGEGLPRAKRWTYDSGVRIPLIVRWPGGLRPGSVSEQLISLIDLGPTVLSLAGLPVPCHLQGQAFLGPQAQPAREYVVATRDRYDTAYDMVRAVRDRRFKYIRNFHPELPYQLWIPYSYTHPGLQEIWRLNLAGQLDGAQQRLLQPTRPPEELYDLSADPHELVNVAGAPQFAGELARLRRVLDEWRRHYDRYGDVPEAEMIRQWYPNAVPPVTAPPRFVVIGPEELGRRFSTGGTYRGPVLVQLYAPEQGSSVEYNTTGRWQLYGPPLRLEPNTTTTIRARAARIGFKDSAEVSAMFTITP
jgi:arylsulfatase A-like enzyme